MVLKIGVEIETIVNEREARSFSIGNYHNGHPITANWKAERDGSINSTGHFSLERPVEFVSKIFRGRKALYDGLDELKNFLTNGRDIPLKNIMYFNKSTGCHIHFSSGRFSFYRSCPAYLFVETRAYFFKLLKKTTRVSDSTKKAIKTQYFRGYARKFKAEEMRQVADRYAEFNFCSEMRQQGMEWRSFNLREVKNWTEFQEMFKIAYRTLLFLEKQVKDWQESGEEVTAPETREREEVVEVWNPNRPPNVSLYVPPEINTTLRVPIRGSL